MTTTNTDDSTESLTHEAMRRGVTQETVWLERIKNRAGEESTTESLADALGDLIGCLTDSSGPTDRSSHPGRMLTEGLRRDLARQKTAES